MKKRFFATVLTLALSAVMLMGCGSSPAEAETDPANIPAEFAEPAESDGPAIPDDSTAEATSNTYVVNEQGEAITQFPNDNGMDDDFGRPPEEDLVPWDVEESEEDVAEEVPVTGEIEGIVVAQGSWQGLSTFQFTIFAINPETGASRRLNQFTYNNLQEFDTDHIQPPWRLGIALFGNWSDNFSSDYTKVVATKTFVGSGEKHAGWLDANGNFFDVTAALGEQAQNDFDEPAMYYGVGFQNDIFIYVSSDYKTYYGVTMDNITPGASWEIDTTDKLLALDYHTWSWLGDYRPTCWIDDDRVLVEEIQNRQGDKRCRIATVSAQTLDVYLPGDDTHSNWSAIASPDGDSVAFFSQRLGGEDINMYIASISGDNPIKLETDFTPSFTMGSRATPVNGGDFCYILGWR